MNNIQLAIFLEKYQELLSRAIADVRSDLPPETIVISKNIFGGEVENAPILDPLYDLLHSLNSDIEILKNNPDGEHRV